MSPSFNKYGLYAYGEGKMIYKVRGMQFSGIPVLFIPGNRGSPKQGIVQVIEFYMYYCYFNNY